MHIEITCNTDDEVLFQNVEANSRRPLEWITELPAHEGHAVIVGGGPSLAENIEKIRARQEHGQKVFALNGAAKFLSDRGITADYQVICDARPQTAQLVGPAKQHLFASQCDPLCFDKADALLWHPKIDGIEDHLPDQRESLTLIGGGTTVGLSAMCLAYTLGYRGLHLYGYDSSHRDDQPKWELIDPAGNVSCRSDNGKKREFDTKESAVAAADYLAHDYGRVGLTPRAIAEGHAYAQPMNASEPVCKVTVLGRTFTASLAMAKQAELFPILSDQLIDLGCTITVEGDGLLPFIVSENARMAAMTEQQKYEQMWSIPEYRTTAPGEHVARVFVDVARPEGRVIDFGCGTGRGALEIMRLTECELLLIDFTSNSRDPEAMELPFIQADLSQPIPAKANFGFCTDVMEHIPPEQVDVVLQNIMACVPNAFFQISLVPDNMGALIGRPLHLSVHAFDWWDAVFARLALRVLWSEDCGDSAMFYVTTNHLEN